MKRFLLWLERQRDKFRGAPLRTLTCHGNWFVRYVNGERTYYMDYFSACNLAAAFGGKVLHRNQCASQENQGDRA